MKTLQTFILILACNFIYGQGYNHNYLIGYSGAWPPWTNFDKGIIKIDSINFSIFGLSRKMIFYESQSNIANDTGEIKFYTNGCWIANALEDTMLNGSGLNPDPYVTQWCTPPSALPYPQANIILPYPGDSNKYVLFHHGGSHADPDYLPLISYYSVIDMTLDGGMGGVMQGQKNIILVNDTLNIGFTACKHANGRDWWIILLKGNSNQIYTWLLTPQGIQQFGLQSLTTSIHQRNTFQPIFSPDGNKFAYRYYFSNLNSVINEVRIFDFNRCNGTFTNPRIISWNSIYGSLGLSFSSNSKYLYTVSDFDTIYQINTDTSNIQAFMQVVAVNDGFYSPLPPSQTNFWLMYLAANGKIILSSANGVIDLHYINYPDSSGMACDVQQHSLHMPCLIGGNHLNHPNYYLGCDTTLGCPCLIPSGMEEPGKHDFKFSISPNPTSGSIKIIYLMPQNKSGVFEVYDITGKKVFSYSLPPWSTLQHFDLSIFGNGVYSAAITSDGKRAVRKLVVIHE